MAENVWTDEADKWDHLRGLRVSKVLGTQKQRIHALETDADLYVINRENVVWLVEYLGAKWPFDMVIIDELSSFKSASSKRWRALRRVIKLSRYVIGLTGTPAANGYMDLWPEVYLIDGGARLGRTLGEYRSRYFNPGARKGHIVYEWKLKPGAKEAIDARLRDICLSMSAADWLTLPPTMYNRVAVRMSSKARTLYDKFKRDKVLPLLETRAGLVATEDLEEMDTAVTGETAATVSGKLLQMANGAVYETEGDVLHIHDAKLDALEELIEAANGQPVLVFYAYRHDLARIKARFPKAEELSGGETIHAWNRGEVPMLLCHPASTAYGLNLQAGGHIIVWFGLTWSLELYQQANARLSRQGQTEAVIIHHLICKDTLDEHVMAALEQKDVTQRGLLDALKGYLKGEKEEK